MNGLFDVFPDLHDLFANNFEGARSAKPTIMIAFTARSGSTHLCASIHAAGHSTTPTEIFNDRGPAQSEKNTRNVSNFKQYIRAFSEDSDEAFIFKSYWPDFEIFAAHALKMFPNLRVVYLERKNVAAQAVSLFRAHSENVWHKKPGDILSAKHQPLKLDVEQTLAFARDIISEKNKWEGWFSFHGIKPLRICYEDFERNVNLAIRKISLEMNLPLAENVPFDSGLKKLGDETSNEWSDVIFRRLWGFS